jgi:glycogen debranching enzyme
LIAADTLADSALAVLRRNDTGRFVRPAPHVYPFQWNWDSALVAIGLARVDPARGREEVRSLLDGQWDDGMVPHMIFHPQPVDYEPGPELWGSSEFPGAPAVATSGLTQPPVLATAVRALHEAAPDDGFLTEVLPALDAWHDWLARARDFDGSGLVAILHPWESADNAPRFDRALERVDLGRVPVFIRSDRRHLDPAERPTDLDYRRYVAIVDRLRRRSYRPSLADASFAFVDLPFNSILAAAEVDLAWLQREVGADDGRAVAAAARLSAALEECWDEAAGAYRERDLHGAEVVGETVADVFPLYAGVPDERTARRLFEESLWTPERFGPAPWGITTVSRSSPAFDSRRYWRGPVWINVNWFLVRGLERCGLAAEAEELRQLTLRLVSESGFAEYYHPGTGEPLGSRDFSWSAALTLDLLAAGRASGRSRDSRDGGSASADPASAEAG